MHSFIWTTTIMYSLSALLGIVTDTETTQRIATLISLGIAIWGWITIFNL